MVVTVTVSYAQILWRDIKTVCTKITVVDAISGALGNPLAFFDFTAWEKHTVLLCCALVAW